VEVLDQSESAGRVVFQTPSAQDVLSLFEIEHLRVEKGIALRVDSSFADQVSNVLRFRVPVLQSMCADESSRPVLVTPRRVW
jgi:hypothetical protein